MATRKSKPEIVRPTEAGAVRAAIVDGLQMLAGVCDWAATRDNAGFNSPDAASGHALADYSATASLTDIELVIGFRLLRKYEKRQLKNAGIVLPDAQTVTTIFGAGIDIERAKDQYEGAIRLGTNDQGAEVVLVVFDYSQSKQYLLKQCVKPFGFARFEKNPSGYGGYWTAPIAALHAIAERFPGFAQTADVVERLQQPRVVPAALDTKPAQPRGTWTRMSELTQPNASRTAPAAQTVRTERPLGTIELDGNEVVVHIERLWEVDRAQALRAKDQCKAYCGMHGGRGYDPGARVWRINKKAALVVTKALPTFHQSDDVRNLASEQMHTIRHAA